MVTGRENIFGSKIKLKIKINFKSYFLRIHFERGEREVRKESKKCHIIFKWPITYSVISTVRLN